jgi:hypothetical protein
VWLLADGIVVTRVSVPMLPPLEAAVEVPSAPGGRSAAAARELFAPLVPRLREALVPVVLRLADSITNYPEPEQRRVRHILLEAARRGIARTEILRLPILRGIEQGRFVRRSLAQVATYAHPVAAIPPFRDPADYLLPRFTLVLDSSERALLAEILDLRLVIPTERRARPTHVQRLRDWLDRVCDRLRRGSYVPLPESGLTRAERQLLGLLRPQLQPAADAIGLCAGRLRPVVIRQGGRRLLVVGRENRDLQAALRLVPDDPAWAFPALAALTRGREASGDGARGLWWRRIGRAQGASPPEPGG